MRRPGLIPYLPATKIPGPDQDVVTSVFSYLGPDHELAFVSVLLKLNYLGLGEMA